MTLATLGSVIKFALKIETTIKELYQIATENEEEKEFKETCQTKINQSLKNIKKLKKIQRENTTEMILEPIEDFKQEPYREIFDLDSDKITLAKLNELEFSIIQFYKEAAKKVSFIREVAYIFEQLSLKHSVE